MCPRRVAVPATREFCAPKRRRGRAQGNLQPRLPSALVVLNVLYLVVSRYMGTRLCTECQLQVHTGWAPGSGTRFPESPDETLESSIGLSLLGSHQGNDRGTQKNRRERPLVPSVVAGFR